jgi:glutathione peroxidase
MSNKKKILIYTLIMIFSFFSKSNASYDKLIYDFSIKDINGNLINFVDYKNKAILIVNVASKCGFTKQYTGLQKIYELYEKKGLIVLGVPSNQFGGQEPGTSSEIKNFCETNFNISFPLTEKTIVKGENSHPIFLWAKKNYGNSAVPKWNFHKILINKEGKIEKTFGSFVKPDSSKLTGEIEKIID